MYYLPQEIEVWYVIPTIRSMISHCLIKEFDLTYEEAGKILGVSRAAVCQYIKGKRAMKIKFPKELNSRILSSCKVLIKDETKIIEELEKILNHIKNQEVQFSICGKTKESSDDYKILKFTNGGYQKAI